MMMMMMIKILMMTTTTTTTTMMIQMAMAMLLKFSPEFLGIFAKLQKKRLLASSFLSVYPSIR
jgi:hypothetical protein